MILFGHICTLIDFMADVKPIFPIFYFITLTDVFIKVSVADLIATFLADVMPLCLCNGNTTHVSCYSLILNKVADVIANLFMW